MCAGPSEGLEVQGNPPNHHFHEASCKCHQAMPVNCTDSGLVPQAGPQPNYAAEYAARLHDTAAPSSQQPVRHAQARAIYNAGLDAAAAKAKASVSAQNPKRRSQLRAEVSSFLAAMPYGRTLQTCTPEYLLVYLEQVYIPQHAGSQLPDGTLIAAPSNISNILSQFRLIFKELGRGAVWDDEAASGNPAAAFRLSQWRQGNEKIQTAAGFLTTGAKEMTEAEMMQLQTSLAQAAFHTADSSSYDRAVLARDGFAFCLLWQTGMRGINASDVTMDDFKLPGQGRGSLRAYLESAQPVQTQHPGIIEVQPRRTMTHSANPHSISIQPAAVLLLDVWIWLLAVYTHSALAKQSIIQYLVRPSQAAACPPCPAAHSYRGNKRRGYQFSEQPLTRQGLHSRLKLHLGSIGAYEGESMHSFRRAMAQRSTAAGEDPRITMQRMLLQTDRMFHGTYAPAGRHESGVKRVRSSTVQARASAVPAATHLVSKQVGYLATTHSAKLC